MLPVLLALVLAGCDSPIGEPVPETTQPAHIAENALPVVLTYPADAVMEARIAGTLRWRGPCLYLDTGSERSLILWSDRVSARRVGADGWAVEDASTGERFGEGDFLQGGGGSMPEDADLEALTPEEIPFECEGGAAIQFHSVVVADRPARPAGALPDPPPPPPDPPSVIDTVKGGGGESGEPWVEVIDIDNPREALFAHLIETYRQERPERALTLCLTDAPAPLVAKLDARFGNIASDRNCVWKDGEVVRSTSGQPAAFVHAHIDCSGRQCAAEGGATFANLGGEGWGFRMRRRGDGWLIQRAGISWIS